MVVVRGDLVNVHYHIYLERGQSNELRKLELMGGYGLAPVRLPVNVTSHPFIII